MGSQRLVEKCGERLSARDLFWTWTTTVAVGEFLGFAAPALAGAAAGASNDLRMLIAMVVGGAIEGAILGVAQAHVLRRIFPRLSGRRWVVLTSAGASFAWLLGMAPSTFHASWSFWPVPVVIAAAGILATGLLASIGTAQYVELRRHVDGAWIWIVITAGAWCAGLLAFSVVAPPLWQQGQSQVVILLIGLLAGALMAATMGATSGLALTRMLAGRDLIGHERS